jgi:hypothetical protein
MSPSQVANSLLCAAMILTVGASVPAKAQSTPPDIVLTQKDAGKDVTLTGHQRLIVRLPDRFGTAGYGWSVLMHPGGPLAFTDAPPAAPAPQLGPNDLPMVGGRGAETVIAFRPAKFTERSSQPVTLIYCNSSCDVKDKGVKIFHFAVRTKKE